MTSIDAPGGRVVRRLSRRRQVLATVTVGSALLTVLLSGCSAEAGPVVQPTLTTTPAATQLITALMVPSGTVVATGQFKGRARGQVRVVSNGNGDYAIELRDLKVTTRKQLRLGLAPDERVFNCAGFDGLNLEVGALRSGAEQDFLLHPGYAPHAANDPSFLKAVAIKNDTDQMPLPDCVDHTFATAALKWSMPDLHPQLKVLDSGARPGATGHSSLRDQAPAAYTVAGGDTLTSIAQRFNITVNDLFYLNPQRSRGESPTAYTGETLNLDRATR